MVRDMPVRADVGKCVVRTCSINLKGDPSTNKVKNARSMARKLTKHLALMRI